MRGKTGNADPDSESRNRSGEGNPKTGDPVRNDDAVNKERPPKSGTSAVSDCDCYEWTQVLIVVESVSDSVIVVVSVESVVLSAGMLGAVGVASLPGSTTVCASCS